MNDTAQNTVVKPVDEVLHAQRVIARVTIELTAPLSISTGEVGDAADNALVRDANGLPVIPGASLAGMLRAAWRGAASVKTAFGFQDRSDEADPPAQRSLVRTSWGYLHSSKDKPVEGLRTPTEVKDDPILSAARRPQVRDHVRIGETGTVDGDGKYTRASVMVGNRFTFELETSGSDAEDWMDALIELLIDPVTRLGGRTRAGLGGFKVVRARRRSYDLKTSEGFTAWTTRPMALAEDFDGTVVNVTDVDGVARTIALTPTEPWQIGGGDAEAFATLCATAPDIVPYTERRVVWDPPKGSRLAAGRVGDLELVVPASAIKGALRHRTVFHLRCDGVADDANDAYAGELFGRINDQDDSGLRGFLVFDDVRLPLQREGLLASTHVALGRFTGAPVGGHLFDEISIDDGRPVEVVIDVRRWQPPRDETNDQRHVKAAAERLELAAKAFQRAVEDLCDDRLQLGAGAGRGYGYFEGSAPPNGWVEAALKGELA